MIPIVTLALLIPPVPQAMPAEPRFVLEIPKIMRKFGDDHSNSNWKVAAKLQDFWLQASEAVVAPDPVYDFARPKFPASTGISMEWVLDPQVDSKGFAGKGLKAIMGSLKTPNALDRLAKRLRAQFGATTYVTLKFGDLDLSPGKNIKALHEQYYQSAPVDYGEDGPALDPLTAALGRFRMYAIPQGEAKREGGKIKGTITKVGIYFLDSFDFQGFQPLGFWMLPGKISFSDFAGAKYVQNETYRRYREESHQGGDFLTVSDVKIASTNIPFEFDEVVAR